MNTNKPVEKQPYEAPAVCDILPVTIVYGGGFDNDSNMENPDDPEGDS